MRKIVITEEELYSIIENVITELNKDINEPLWNVYRIPSKIGANGYSISSSLNENNLLNQLISFAKNKWKEGKTVVSIDDEDGSGYLFKYIIYCSWVCCYISKSKCLLYTVPYFFNKI